MASNLIQALDEYAKQGLFAIPAFVSLDKNGYKDVKRTMPHSKMNTAIRTPAKWHASRDRILEYVEKKNYNFLAIKCGPLSNVFVFDVDVHDKIDEDIEAGTKLWKELIREHGEPETLSVSTCSGGLHYYFDLEETVKNGLVSNKCFKGLDYNGQVYGIDDRGEGGIAFAPPSAIAPNCKYTWNGNPVRQAINAAPAWVIDIINRCTKGAGQLAPKVSVDYAMEVIINDQNMFKIDSCDDENEEDEPMSMSKAKSSERKIAEAMMTLLRNRELHENVRFSGNISSHGPEGTFYSFICEGPRRCIHGHQHNGSNNLTLIKKGWIILYR
jgi:hypothetical protein